MLEKHVIGYLIFDSLKLYNGLYFYQCFKEVWSEIIIIYNLIIILVENKFESLIDLLLGSMTDVGLFSFHFIFQK